MFKYIIIIFFFQALLPCHAMVKDSLNVDSLLYYIDFIGLNIDSIPNIVQYKKSYEIEYGDEGLSWKKINFQDNGKNVIVMETNWVDVVHISRITILSSKIKYKSIYVGQQVETFQCELENIVVPCQDGFMLLKIKDHDNVYLQMDLSNVPPYSPLWQGEYKVAEIPKDLKIESIILTTRN